MQTLDQTLEAVNVARRAPTQALRASKDNSIIYNTGHWYVAESGKDSFELVEIANSTGGERQVLHASSKSEMRALLCALLVGIDIGKAFTAGESA